jgi:FdhD protein
MTATERRQIVRWVTGGDPRFGPDDIAREEPLEIQVNRKPVSVTMRTPGNDQELAAGFLLTEGVLQSRQGILNMQPFTSSEVCNSINLDLAGDFDMARLTRHVFASSSCGICGKASIEAVRQHFEPIEGGMTVTSGILLKLPARLLEAQTAFARTGGLHAAAIFDEQGELIVLREDVGRHNAVDKALGYGILRGLLPFDRHILLVSGRASFEIVQKALGGRIPIVAAVSAPSSLAITLAEESNQSLAGFLRDGRMNLYSCPERILL